MIGAIYFSTVALWNIYHASEVYGDLSDQLEHGTQLTAVPDRFVIHKDIQTSLSMAGLASILSTLFWGMIVSVL